MANAQWLLRMLRSFLRPSRDCRAPKEKPTSAPSEGSGPQKCSKAGGPWRAFVREIAFGQKGSPDLSAIGVAYRQLPPEERQRLEKKGEKATAAAEAGGNAFGSNSRDVQRLAKKRSFAEVCAHGTVAPADQRQRLALQSASGATNSSEQVCISGGPVLCGDSLAPVRAFTLALREERAVALPRTTALATAIVKHERGSVQRFESVCGFDESKSRVHRASEFVSRPTLARPCKAFTWRPAGGAERVLQLCELQLGSVAGRPINAALDSVWAKQNTTLQQPDGATPELASNIQKSVCHRAGMCVCSGEGKRLAALGQAIGKQSKASSRKAACTGDGWAWRKWRWPFWGRPRSRATPRAARQRNTCGFISAVARTALGNRATTRCPRTLPCPPSAPTPPAAANATFTGRFQKYQMLAQFGLSFQWHMVVYMVSFSEKVIATFIPDGLELSLATRHERFHEIWTPWRAHQLRRHRRSDSWGAVLDALDGGEDVSHSPTSLGRSSSTDEDTADSADDASGASSSSVKSEEYISLDELPGYMSESGGGSESCDPALDLADALDSESELLPLAAAAPEAQVPASQAVAPMEEAPAASGRHVAEVVFRLGGDQDDRSAPSLVWYDSGRFYGYCKCGSRDRCRLNRSSAASAAPPISRQAVGPYVLVASERSAAWRSACASARCAPIA